MKNDQNAILDDLLSRWHEWARGYRLSAQAASPIGRNALRAKGEQTIDAISEDQWYDTTMAAIELAVMGDKQHLGGMEEPWRTAICCDARNCYTGRSVWLSPRLPQDKEARDVVILEARVQLLGRLVRAGVV